VSVAGGASAPSLSLAAVGMAVASVSFRPEMMGGSVPSHTDAAAGYWIVPTDHGTGGFLFSRLVII
jgi:hypothetical protein